MEKNTVQLTVEESQGLSALRQAMDKVPARRKPVALRLARGSRPMTGDDVLLVVISQDGAVVHHKKLPDNDATLEAICLMLQSADVAVEKVAAERSRRGAPRLSKGEEKLLHEAGMERNPANTPGALERSRIEYEMLVHDSLTLQEAGRRLHVGTSRLRQRLSPGARTLFGVMVGRSWRLPKFQFGTGGKLVRGLETVLPRIRADAHPLAVQTWFSTPHQDLAPGEDGRCFTPLSWLAAGHPVAAVASLAGEI